MSETGYKNDGFQEDFELDTIRRVNSEIEVRYVKLGKICSIF